MIGRPLVTSAKQEAFAVKMNRQGGPGKLAMKESGDTLKQPAAVYSSCFRRNA